MMSKRNQHKPEYRGYEHPPLRWYANAPACSNSAFDMDDAGMRENRSLSMLDGPQAKETYVS